MIDVTAKKDGKEATIQYDFGNDLDDAVAKFGKDVVFSNFVQSAKITLQSIVRRYLVTDGDIQGLTTTWKPGMQMQRTSVPARVAIISEFKNMSPEEKKAFLIDLKGK